VRWDEDTDSEGDAEENDEDELTAYAARIGKNRPAARTRTQWTRAMDEQLLETVVEVGTGNWPRVLLVAHGYHRLTNVDKKVRCVASPLRSLTHAMPEPYRASPPLRAATLP
jgi:hypothetical protein